MKNEFIKAKNLQLMITSPNAVATFGTDLTTTLWNPGAEELFGYTMAQSLGRNIFDLISSQDRINHDSEDFHTCLNGEIVDQSYVSRKSKNEKWLVLSTRLIPVFDENGDVISGIAVFRDHTQEIRERQLLMEALNLAKMGSWEVLNYEKMEFRTSDQLLRLLDLEEADRDDLTLFINCFDKQCVKKLNQAIHASLAEGSSSEMQLTQTNYRVEGDPQVRTFSISWSAETQEEQTVRLYGIVQDITADTLQKQKIANQQAQLIGKNRIAALGELSAGIAHEVNNPMAIISGFVETIQEMVEQDGDLNKELLRSQVKKIDQCVDRVTKIVKSLRNFSRDTQRDPFEIWSVKDIIDETLTFCKERIEQSDIIIRNNIHDPKLNVACRPTEISQVLLNLLTNAHDAIVFRTGDNWITIDAITRTNGGIEIHVTDSGEGIPEEIRAKIMEPFFTTKPIGKGTGLGLSLSFGIMQDHGGDLIFDPSGRHTKFIIEFPPPETMVEQDPKEDKKSS